MRTRATLRSAELGFFGVVVYTRVHTPGRWGAATFFLRPLPDFSPGVATFFFGVTRPLRTSCEVVGIRCVMLAALGGLGHADRADWRGHERGSDDHEHECERLQRHADRTRWHRVAEHDDPAGDASDVRCRAGHRDHGHGLAVL